MEQNSLLNFIKYCLGYVKLTRQRFFAAQSKLSVELSDRFFNLDDLLESDTNDNFGRLVSLETFYSIDPEEITDETEKQYSEEKSLANKLEEIYNKYRNDPYTKQTILSFGHYKIEIPLEEEESELGLDYLDEEKEQVGVRTKTDRYPLFSLPVVIEKIFEGGAGKYFIKPIDSEIQVNISILERILGEDLYYKLIEELGNYELEGDLSLPIVNKKIFNEIWDKIRAQLKLTDAKFNERSFVLNEMRLAISPRANYFLADDLQELSKLEEDELNGTSLASWTENEDLSLENEVPREGDLYFPFPYDRYQLRTLSVIDNKAAIVQGPPGTGKSQTISNLLCHLAATGKRVLFVSQKAQALKVVKDMLKKTGVRYLFGYVPNPRSVQLDEEDEIDGIAPQLAALDSHVEKLGYKFYPRRRLVEYKANNETSTNKEVSDIAKRKTELIDSFNKSIEVQRLFWRLQQELKDLKEYKVEVSNLKRFQNVFSNETWKKIKSLKSDTERFSEAIKSYEKTKKKAKFDKLFSALDLGDSCFSESIQKIRDDIAKSGYDGHINIIRFMNNTFRKWHLSKVWSALPREFIDYIESYLNRDISKAQALKNINELSDYCLYYEKKQDLEGLESELKKSLSSCGLTEKEFFEIDDLILRNSAKNINGVKEKILRAAAILEELNELETKNQNVISATLKEVEKSRRERVAIYLQNIVNRNITEKLKEGVTVRSIVKKLARAFGKSKKAFKTFDRLRRDPDNFHAMMDLIPVWIMELDDASRIIPLEPGIFDYVLFDESSQCNIAYALPAMFRAKKALFVGDSEQMRDNTIIFKSNRSFDELARRYQIPPELQIKATGEAVQSILDIAEQRGLLAIPLRNHYRSPSELIGFSNEHFYRPKGRELIILNSNYLTYKDTNRIMVIHPIEIDWDKEISDKISVSEAEAILEFFRELKSDEYYKNKSVGILSFFNEQARCIRELFEKEGFKEEKDNYKIGIIEGIQGDEKDIIIYSFVIRSPDQKNRYVPLTGEYGNIRADINKGRVNVAFSRARLQTHCFVSMSIEEIPNGIWIKKYLEYVQNNGDIKFFSTELNPFDSYFEEEFYNFIHSKLRRGYRAQNQVKSCGFKVDFVISNTKNGKKIAVECDGPTHFQDEIDEESGIYVENDEERQRILEAAGWEFYRIKYSDWINEKFNRSIILDDIIRALSIEEKKIAVTTIVKNLRRKGKNLIAILRPVEMRGKIISEAVVSSIRDIRTGDVVIVEGENGNFVIKKVLLELRI